MPWDIRAWHERLERLSSHHTDAWAPAIDVYETAAAYIVTVEVPGMSRDQIDLTFEESRLTLRGHREDHRARKGVLHFHQIERSHGAFARTFEFADRIDVDKTNAELASGVLSITLPKAAHAPARRIDVS